jgi:hypothetical protein
VTISGDTTARIDIARRDRLFWSQQFFKII